MFLPTATKTPHLKRKLPHPRDPVIVQTEYREKIVDPHCPVLGKAIYLCTARLHAFIGFSMNDGLDRYVDSKI